jgi:tripartite ATP-independent transporter DctP family solute receptor
MMMGTWSSTWKQRAPSDYDFVRHGVMDGKRWQMAGTMGDMVRTVRLVVLALLLMGAVARAEDEPLRLSLAHIYPPGTPWFETADRFAGLVDERSHGRIKVHVADSGSTGDWPASLEALRTGAVDIVLQIVATLDQYAPIAGLDGFPFLIRDIDHFEKVYDGPVGRALFAEIARQSGRHLIGAGYRGARVLTSNRKITSLADMQGLRVRVPPVPVIQRSIEAMGATAIPMGMTELHLALEQGLVDAQENPLEIILSFHLYDVQKYVILTRHSFGAMSFIFDEQRYQALPREVQTLLTETGEQVMREATARTAAEEGAMREELERAGMQFVEVDQKAFEERLAPLSREFPELANWASAVRAVK